MWTQPENRAEDLLGDSRMSSPPEAWLVCDREEGVAHTLVSLDRPCLPTPPPSSPTPTSHDTKDTSTGRPAISPSVLPPRLELEPRGMQRLGMVLPGKEAITLCGWRKPDGSFI